MNEVVQVRMAGWAAMVRERAESGLTIKEWCARNDISEHAYYYRLKQLRNAALAGSTVQSNAAGTDVQFFKVADHKTGSLSSGNVALRIRHGDTIMEVSNDASGSILSFLKEVMICAV